MEQTALSPNIEEGHALTVLGIPFEATPESDIGGFWGRFGLRLNEFEGSVPERQAYGVVYDFDHDRSKFMYLTGVPYDGTTAIPDGWTTLDLPRQKYAVFETTLDQVEDTVDRIYDVWLPASQFERAPGPEFEYYGPNFDAEDPTSIFTIHIPVHTS